MCTIFFSYDRHPDYWLIVAANRDEFYDRPTREAGFWQDHPEILAGRDLRGNGTWMGITRTGRIAAITNVRDPNSMKVGAPTRGDLVTDFLAGNKRPQSYLETLDRRSGQYNGFNLIVGNGKTLCYYSNQNRQPCEIPPGVHGLSNHLLNTPWPKVKRGTVRFAELVNGEGKISHEEIFTLLQDGDRAPDGLLPETGVGLAWERLLSSLHINGDIYGTRTASLLLMGRDGNVTFLERTYSLEGETPATHKTRKFTFRVSP